MADVGRAKAAPKSRDRTARSSITVRDSICPDSSSGVHHVGFKLRGLKAFSA